MNGKVTQTLQWLDSLEKYIVNFNGDDPFYKGFSPYREQLKLEDGKYLTIRCGLNGIYTCVNYIMNNEWMVEVADASRTIAYRELKPEEDLNIE